MEIIESWEDHNANSYAIVRYSEEEQREYGDKTYEAMWLDDLTSPLPELHSFGGNVGYTKAHFDTIEEGRDFLLKGISEYDRNPEIWLEMVEA
jgi:hypothetical protein